MALLPQTHTLIMCWLSLPVCFLDKITLKCRKENLFLFPYFLSHHGRTQFPKLKSLKSCTLYSPNSFDFTIKQTQGHLLLSNPTATDLLQVLMSFHLSYNITTPLNQFLCHHFFSLSSPCLSFLTISPKNKSDLYNNVH